MPRILGRLALGAAVVVPHGRAQLLPAAAAAEEFGGARVVLAAGLAAGALVDEGNFPQTKNGIRQKMKIHQQCISFYPAASLISSLHIPYTGRLASGPIYPE